MLKLESWRGELSPSLPVLRSTIHFWLELLLSLVSVGDISAGEVDALVRVAQSDGGVLHKDPFLILVAADARQKLQFCALCIEAVFHADTLQWQFKTVLAMLKKCPTLSPNIMMC